MRTNLIEGLIIGCGIGGVVLVARWLFHSALLIEVGVVLLGGVLLAVIQVALSRRFRRPPPPSEEPPPPPAPPPAPLISPSLSWGDELAPDARPDPAAPDPEGEPAHAPSAGDSPEPERKGGNAP